MMNVCLSIVVGDEVECLNFTCEEFRILDGMSGKFQFWGIDRNPAPDLDICSIIDSFIVSGDIIDTEEWDGSDGRKYLNFNMYCSDIHDMTISY